MVYEQVMNERLKQTIKIIEKIAIETPELDFIKDIAINDAKKYNFGVPWWFIDDQQSIKEGEDIFNTKLVEEEVKTPKLETIIEEDEESSSENEEKWIVKEKTTKRKSFKNISKTVNKKPITQQSYIPRLICKTDYDIKILKTIFDKSVGYDVFYSSKNENGYTTINLNLKGNYTIGTDGFNLIQGVLYSHNNDNKFRLTYKQYTIYLDFHESVKISNMNYYQNTIQGIQYNKLRSIL
jgi:hypothetical protein